MSVPRRGARDDRPRRAVGGVSGGDLTADGRPAGNGIGPADRTRGAAGPLHRRHDRADRGVPVDRVRPGDRGGRRAGHHLPRQHLRVGQHRAEPAVRAGRRRRAAGGADPDARRPPRPRRPAGRGARRRCRAGDRLPGHGGASPSSAWRSRRCWRGRCSPGWPIPTSAPTRCASARCSCGSSCRRSCSTPPGWWPRAC